MQTIFRSNRSKNWTSFPNCMLRDKRISFRARGMLAMILSNTEDWIVHRTWLKEQTEIEGRDACMEALRELERVGYAVYSSQRAETTNAFIGHVWTFFDAPVPVEERSDPDKRKKPQTENPSVENPLPEKPSVDNSELSAGNNNDLSPTEPRTEKPPSGNPSDQKNHRKKDNKKGTDTLPSKHKGSLEEVRLYCAKAGIPESDADWFFYKGEGNGWTNGGKPIKNWQATLLAWKAGGYLPTQKNGSSRPHTVSSSGFD